MMPSIVSIRDMPDANKSGRRRTSAPGMPSFGPMAVIASRATSVAEVSRSDRAKGEV